jgi:hypothetical protein
MSSQWMGFRVDIHLRRGSDASVRKRHERSKVRLDDLVDVRYIGMFESCLVEIGLECKAFCCVTLPG